MKAVRITQFSPPDKTSPYTKYRKYSVYLGNGRTHYFENRKDALSFLVDTSRFLTERLHEANHLYKDLHSKYRELWFYLKPLEDQRSRLQLEAIDAALSLAVERCAYENGNHFAFTHLLMIAERLGQLADHLRAVCQAHNLHATTYEMRTAFLRSKGLTEAMSNYDLPQKALKEKGAHRAGRLQRLKVV